MKFEVPGDETIRERLARLETSTRWLSRLVLVLCLAIVGLSASTGYLAWSVLQNKENFNNKISLIRDGEMPLSRLEIDGDLKVNGKLACESLGVLSDKIDATCRIGYHEAGEGFGISVSRNLGMGFMGLSGDAPFVVLQNAAGQDGGSSLGMFLEKPDHGYLKMSDNEGKERFMLGSAKKGTLSFLQLNSDKATTGMAADKGQSREDFIWKEGEVVE